jgi:hypothetical protein
MNSFKEICNTKGGTVYACGNGIFHRNDDGVWNEMLATSNVGDGWAECLEMLRSLEADAGTWDSLPAEFKNRVRELFA